MNQLQWGRWQVLEIIKHEKGGRPTTHVLFAISVGDFPGILGEWAIDK
jgi:hypothetical protein